MSEKLTVTISAGLMDALLDHFWDAFEDGVDEYKLN